jgi:transcriptional regulator with XRE-family HTH domain
VSGPKIKVDNDGGRCYIDGDLKGTQMKAVREANGLTQAQLADMLGVSRAYLTQMEIGARRISVRTALAFAQVINQHKDRTSRGRQSQTA